ELGGANRRGRSKQRDDDRKCAHDDPCRQREHVPFLRNRIMLSILSLAHVLVGEPASALGSSPRAGFAGTCASQSSMHILDSREVVWRHESRFTILLHVKPHAASPEQCGTPWEASQMRTAIFAPVLALVLWTFVMLVW